MKIQFLILQLNINYNHTAIPLKSTKKIKIKKKQ